VYSELVYGWTDGSWSNGNETVGHAHLIENQKIHAQLIENEKIAKQKCRVILTHIKSRNGITDVIFKDRVRCHDV